MEYKIVLYLLVGVLLGLIISNIALYTFRKSVIKNIKACCAKCKHCSKSTEGFLCDKSGKTVNKLFNPEATCKSFES